jgi:hypothetical protein
MCGNFPHINSCLFVVFALVVRWNTTDIELHTTDAIVPLARSFFLGRSVTGAHDVVSVMPPSPVLPEFRAPTSPPRGDGCLRVEACREA